MNKKAKKGFTLIEILIVVVIISLLATLVVPRLFKKVGTSKLQICKTQIAALENALKMFKLDTGRFPSTAEGLQALMTQPGGTNNWDGPYLEKGLPKDPWGRDFYYEHPGKNYVFEVYSYGADGAAGGEEENSDVFNYTIGNQ
jgi:general secretion pathway protein G